MSQKRDLGPLLALAGGAIAIIAVIAGFIITGGPGDARDRRLDQMTIGRLDDIFQIIKCAYNGAGTAPATFEAAMKTQGRIAKDEPIEPCDFGIAPEDIPVFPGRSPPNVGDVSYEPAGKDTATLCANFHTSDAEARRPGDFRPYGGDGLFRAPHPAGVHCYDLELMESVVADR